MSTAALGSRFGAERTTATLLLYISSIPSLIQYLDKTDGYPSGIRWSSHSPRLGPASPDLCPCLLPPSLAPRPLPCPLPPPGASYFSYVSLLNQVVMMGTQLYHDACVPQHHKYAAHQIALLYVSAHRRVGGVMCGVQAWGRHQCELLYGSGWCCYCAELGGVSGLPARCTARGRFLLSFVCTW